MLCEIISTGVLTAIVRLDNVNHADNCYCSLFDPQGLCRLLIYGCNHWIYLGTHGAKRTLEVHSLIQLTGQQLKL